MLALHCALHSYSAVLRSVYIYASPSGCFGNKLTLDDVKDSVGSFCPRVQFVVAAHDPLGELTASIAVSAVQYSTIGDFR
jgi:hypothetical protein